jgi:hypothetical protein
MRPVTVPSSHCNHAKSHSEEKEERGREGGCARTSRGLSGLVLVVAGGSGCGLAGVPEGRSSSGKVSTNGHGRNCQPLNETRIGSASNRSGGHSSRGAIGVRLDVSLLEVHAQAVDDGLQTEARVGQSFRQNVVNGEFGRLLVQVVLEDDEAVVHLGRLRENRVEIGDDLADVDGAASDLPIPSIESAAVIASPAVRTLRSHPSWNRLSKLT